MVKSLHFICIFLFVLLTLANSSLVMGQDEVVLAQLFSAQGTEFENLVVITDPPPVSELWNSREIRGTAAVPGMFYFYLEYTALDRNTQLLENAWIPLTTGVQEPVVDGVLATIDTRNIADGVYAIRLVVNTLEGDSYSHTLLPMRVNNQRVDELREQVQAAIESGEIVIPSQESPEVIEETISTDPIVTPNTTYSAINVRRCDIADNAQCPIVATLGIGQTAVVLGVAPSGWYFIQLQSGVVGYIASEYVEVSGDFSNVQLVTPPDPIVTTVATPVPEMTTEDTTTSSVVVVESSIVLPNVVVDDIDFESSDANCGEVFDVEIEISNIGDATSPSGTVTLQDVHPDSGTVTYTGYGDYPELAAGESYEVDFEVLITLYNDETHEFRAYVGGSRVTTSYTLNGGICDNFEDVSLPDGSNLPDNNNNRPANNLPRNNNQSDNDSDGD